jgi:hypothetical protein
VALLVHILKFDEQFSFRYASVVTRIFYWFLVVKPTRFEELRKTHDNFDLIHSAELNPYVHSDLCVGSCDDGRPEVCIICEDFVSNGLDICCPNSCVL